MIVTRVVSTTPCGRLSWPTNVSPSPTQGSGSPDRCSTSRDDVAVLSPCSTALRADHQEHDRRRSRSSGPRPCLDTASPAHHGPQAERPAAPRDADAWAEHGQVYELGVEDLATGELVGVVGGQRGLDYLSPGQVNLPYAVYPPWRRRGIATMAPAAAMDIARKRGPVEEFVIRAAPDNHASAAVARRLGFRFDHTSDDSHGRLDWWVHSEAKG